TIALTHHERWDGTGYPRALGGEQIPLEGRIAAVADVFDALISDRPYRPALSRAQAYAIMLEGRGTQFDPGVLDLLREIAPGFGEPQPSSLPANGHSAAPRTSVLRPAPAAEAFPIEVLLAAVESAEEALRARSDGRAAVAAALEAFVAIGGPGLLPSVYVVEHERLWLVAQHGYERVRDGFALDQGVIARAARTGELQYVPDVGRDSEFIVAAQEIRSEIAAPFGQAGAPAGVLNVETRRHSLSDEACEPLGRLAQALGDRVEEMRQGVRLDLSSLARLFVDASSLRSVGSIAEFSARTLGRLLGLEATSVCIRQGGGKLATVSRWTCPDAEPEPLSADDLEGAAREAELAGSTCCILDLASIGIAREEDERYRRMIWLPLRVDPPAGVGRGRGGDAARAARRVAARCCARPSPRAAGGGHGRADRAAQPARVQGAIRPRARPRDPGTERSRPARLRLRRPQGGERPRRARARRRGAPDGRRLRSGGETRGGRGGPPGRRRVRPRGPRRRGRGGDGDRRAAPPRSDRAGPADGLPGQRDARGRRLPRPRVDPARPAPGGRPGDVRREGRRQEPDPLGRVVALAGELVQTATARLRSRSRARTRSSAATHRGSKAVPASSRSIAIACSCVHASR